MKSTNRETTNAGSQQTPTRDEHSMPVMVPCIITIPNLTNWKMAAPSTTPNETEPISLKQFNRAATNLDAKGEIQLREYRKYLSNRE